MGSWVVHQDWFTRRYHTSTCTLAWWFMVISTLTLIIAPYFIAMGTQSFWLKTNTYKAQPSLSFGHDVIVSTEGKEPGEGLSFSNNREIRELIQSSVRIPTVRAREEDINDDGIYDIFQLTIVMPLRTGETVTAARLLARFETQFEKPYRMKMDGLAILQHEAALPGAEVYFDADLVYEAREPYIYKTKVDVSANRVFNTTNMWSLDEISVPQLVDRYRSRNESTTIANKHVVWVPGRDTTFTIHAKLRVHTQTIEYTPGLWEVIKFAWIQYFAIWFVIYGLIMGLRNFVYSQQVVETTVVSEVGPKLKRF